MLAIAMSTITVNALNIPMPRDDDTGGVFKGDPSCSQVKAHDGSSLMPAGYCAVVSIDNGTIIKERIKLRKDLKRESGFKAEGSLFESSLQKEPFEAVLAKKDIKDSDRYSNKDDDAWWPAVLDHTVREQKDDTLLKEHINGPMTLKATTGGALVEHRYYSVISTSFFPYNGQTSYYVTLYDPIDAVEKQWTLDSIIAGIAHVALHE
ncbi:hypothetical protein IAT40_001250 [Kwoniella sp. CBS 6097]